MNPPGNSSAQASGPSQAFLRAALLLYVLSVAGYAVLRYGGQWAETDTATLTRSIEAMRDEGTLRPAGPVYPHGFGYQAVSLALLLFSALPPQTLQAILYPFLAVTGLALSALAFFTQATGDGRIAVLAALLLFFQPDMLFVILRGSHEKLDWPLMMVALMLFYRSINQPLRKTVVFVCLFYLTVFAIMATNVFFASTFLAAIVISLALGLAASAVLQRLRVPAMSDFRRLIYVGLSFGVLLFAFMAYLYPPALSNIRTLRTIWDQVSALLLSFEVKGNPYEYISFGWVSPRAYIGLTVFTWLLIISSFAAWLWRGKQMFAGQENLGLRESLDWMLYAGFAIQVALSVLVDFAGVLSQNMQLRVFPGFTVLAVCLLARAVWYLILSPQFQGWRRRLICGAIGLAVVWFAIASVFKATNEPIFSNKWAFYTTTEEAAIRWTDRNVQWANIWTGVDERLREVYRMYYAGQSQRSNIYSVYQIKPQDRYILFSKIERLRALRIGITMPSVEDWDRVYDNGNVFLYHRRPRTPYQR